MGFNLLSLQNSLESATLDGWLFYDFRGSDPLAYSILDLPTDRFLSRRWFYFIPARGEPTKIVHAIEPGALDSLPGSKLVYLSWESLHDHVRAILVGSLRVAMQYSPMNAIPYVSRVDAGTIELVRSFGLEVVTSADLVQQFEAVLSEEEYQTHLDAADKIARICEEGFVEVGRRLRAGYTPTEYEIQQFLMKRFSEAELTTDHAPIVAVDAHAADPHYAPTAQDSVPIRPGCRLLIDLWAKRQEPWAIFADITRVAYVGRDIPADYQRVFEIVRDARDAAIHFVKSSWQARQATTGAQVDDVCRAVIAQAGFADRFIHRTGHSIHRVDHGNGANIDNLETKDDRNLAARTVFSIEPGIYLPGQFGVRSEINMYLREDEAIVTGPCPQHEIFLIDV